MVRVSEFTEAQYGERFVVEPPVEVGEHVIDSLGKLAAVTANGASARLEVVTNLTKEVERTVALLYETSGVNALS